jgi:hypothetical protein
MGDSHEGANQIQDPQMGKPYSDDLPERVVAEAFVCGQEGIAASFRNALA